MKLVFFDGHIVWKQDGEVTVIAVLLTKDGEEQVPHFRALAGITLEGSGAVFSIDGVEYVLRACDLGIRLVRALYGADTMERDRALHDTAETMRRMFGLRLRRISKEHIRPIAA